METIASLKDLDNWLADKLTDWAQVIAMRAAMRALPIVGRADDQWLSRYGQFPIRALCISWAARNFPAHDMRAAASLAATAATSLATDAAASIAASVATSAAARAATSAAADVSAFAGTESAVRALTNSVAFAAYAAADAAASVATDTAAVATFWGSISYDCQWLTRQRDDPAASRIMTRRSLWLGQPPKDWMAEWNAIIEKLLGIDPNYSVWIDWYERRIRGERAAFDIPGDKGRVEDKKILRRLAEATDEDFWGKGHEYVNATLKGWLDEARERVAPPPIIGEVSGTFEITGSATAEVGPLPTPAQDTGAIAYGVNDQGKLDRLPNSDQVHLRDVPDQRRAYNDLREAAAELLAEGQRLGHRLQRALDRFLHSLPDGFEDAEAYLVWRDANALRRLHRAHREAAKRSEPDEAKLELVIAEGLGGLLDLAPQERANAQAEAKAAIPLVDAILANPEIATPEALDDIIADAENAELPADDPYSAQVLLQSNETRKNFLAAALAWGAKTLSSPKQVGKAAAIGAVSGAASVLGGVAMNAIIGIDYGPLLPFIATNAEILQHYVAIAFPSFEHLPSLIDQLKFLWARLRN
jgi:hypothetical protein